jgi:hypothetical protein
VSQKGWGDSLTGRKIGQKIQGMFTVDTRSVPRHSVTCSCGHVYKFKINGRTAAKREETMRWLSGFPCPDCEKKQKQQEKK